MSRAGLLSLLFLYKATSVTADFNEDVENCGLVLDDMPSTLVEPFCHDYVGGYYTPTITYTVTDPPETYYTTQTVDAYCTKEVYPTGGYYPGKPKYPYASGGWKPYKPQPYETGYSSKVYETSKEYGYSSKVYETSKEYSYSSEVYSTSKEYKPYPTSKVYSTGELPPYVYKPYPTGELPPYGEDKSAWSYGSAWLSTGSSTSEEATETPEASETTGTPEASETSESISVSTTITVLWDSGNGTVTVSDPLVFFDAKLTGSRSRPLASWVRALPTMWTSSLSRARCSRHTRRTFSLSLAFS
jgi:hypothetical protein